MLLSYCPEMNQVKPETKIDATLSYNAKHWHIKTPKTFSGAGIKFTGTLTADMLADFAKHKAGWNTYKVTQKAFNKLIIANNVAVESLLS